MMTETAEDLQERIDAQDAALAEAKAEQLPADLAAFVAARDEHGVSNVARLFVPVTPGLPTFALARAPNVNVVKRYRDNVRPAPDKTPDTLGAAEQVCGATLVYPEPDVFAKMCAARPGLKAQLGLAALALASASETASGKA
jgi:hypothetical protein